MQTGSVNIRRGTEGPRHDPYAYEEIIVSRPDGRKVKLHSGLGEWLEVQTAEGRKIRVDESDRYAGPERLRELFAFHSGISVETAAKTPGRREATRYREHDKRCGNENLVAATGYPGESFDYCPKCGFVGGYAFDRSAIE